MITYSAPGKVYLFGEHAVVYGEPAIACAINRRTSASVKLVPSGKIRVDAMGKQLNCMSDEFRYACCAAQTIKRLFDIDFGAEITIKSQLPPRQGLGSSAAVTVSTIKALTEALGIGLRNETVAEIGHQVETAVQGSASPTDTFVSTSGGIVLIEQKNSFRLSSLNIPIVIGATGIERSTGNVIASMSKLKQKYPAVITNILSSIGDITRLGKQKLVDEDFVGLGELMNINQGLLESIGVSNEALNRLVYASRTAGALGAKITGAGHGGCMLAIVQDETAMKVSQAIEKQGGKVLKAAISEIGLQKQRTRLDSNDFA